jgi:hypothetical protein
LQSAKVEYREGLSHRARRLKSSSYSEASSATGRSFLAGQAPGQSYSV